MGGSDRFIRRIRECADAGFKGFAFEESASGPGSHDA
jgi:hypothetical protein